MDFERHYNTEILDEASDLLKEILNLMGYPQIEVELDVSEEQATFNLVGENAREILTNARGLIDPEITNALAWILRRSRIAYASAFNFLVDVDGYRTQRIEELAGMAEGLRDKAMAGLQIDCYGMNPVDRRAVHHSLSQFEEVCTQSEGDGIFRHLQIRSKEKVELPSMAAVEDYQK